MYPVAVVGESFDNEDGSNRRSEIRRCTVGEPAQLLRDPKNKHDKKCVRVISSRGVQIGNLERGSWLSEVLDRSGYVDARIVAINKVGSNFGVVLGVATSEDEDPMTAIAKAEAKPAIKATPPRTTTARPKSAGIFKLLLAALSNSKRRR